MAKKKKETARVVEAVDKKYELMLVLQPELLQSAVEKKLRDFDKFLEENGGTVEMKDIWGKQKLAYKIGQFNAGIYVVYNLTLPTTFNTELDEHMRIDKDIIRFLQLSLKDGYEYAKFEEEVREKEPKEEKGGHKKETGTHKASSKAPTKTEVKDKGKKADADSLDNKLDAILEGDDIKV